MSEQGHLKINKFISSPAVGDEVGFDGLFVGHSLDREKSPIRSPDSPGRYGSRSKRKESTTQGGSRSKCIGGGFGKTTGVFSVTRTVPHKS